MRADGIRNRELILESAARAFATEGADASLNGIARDAGVGIATLFRHFPTREALVEASFSSSLDFLCRAAPAAVDATPDDPAAALGTWSSKYLDYMSQRQGMADTIRALMTDEIEGRVQTVERLQAAISTILSAGSRRGAFRPDVPADDVLKLLGGIALTAGRPGQREQAGRLVEVMLRGLRA